MMKFRRLAVCLPARRWRCYLICFLSQTFILYILLQQLRIHDIQIRANDLSAQDLVLKEKVTKTRKLETWKFKPDVITSNCAKTYNIVYIKMIKCASTTIATMLRHYGYIHNLSFVIPIEKKIYLGWPYHIESDFYRPSRTDQFNMLTEHVVYDKDRLKKIMPGDAVYITSLREPYSEFKSMFNYYNLAEIMGITSNDPISEYLNNIDHYEEVYKSHAASKLRYCIPDGFSMSKNLMAFNLGFPTGFLPNTSDRSHDEKFVSQWLSELESDFTLMVIVEYLYESLVLMRRYLCWSMQDIIHYSLNVKKYSYREAVSPELYRLHRSWSSVDYALYTYFNNTLWTKIRTQGEDFWDEVKSYKSIIKKISKFCQTAEKEVSFFSSHRKSLTVAGNKWMNELVVDRAYCKFLQSELLEEIKEAYDLKSPHININKPSKSFC